MFKALERVMAGILIATIAWHATNGKQGQILSVAGRKGKTHFSYITSVITAFMRNIGISPAGELIIDGVGEAREIRNDKNLKEDVRTLFKRTFV